MIDKIDERNLAQERHTHFLHQCTLMEKTFRGTQDQLSPRHRQTRCRAVHHQLHPPT